MKDFLNVVNELLLVNVYFKAACEGKANKVDLCFVAVVFCSVFLMKI
jgi:hypothetical protein